MVHITLFTPSV